jgi:CBS domain-containing protein
VETVYRRGVEAIPAGCPLPDILRIVGASRSASFPVVDASQELVGVLSFAALRTLLLEDNPGPLIVADDLCDRHVPALTPASSLAEAFRLMEGEGIEDLPVVDPAGRRRVLGMLSRADLIMAYNRTVAALGAVPVRSWLTSSASHWSDDYRVLAVAVPREWIGRSLREIDCRARWGVVVLAVHGAGAAGTAYALPDPDRPLAEGDTVVIAGAADALRSFAQTGRERAASS